MPNKRWLPTPHVALRWHGRRVLHGLAAAAVLFVVPQRAAGQVRASERGSISQIVDGTLIEVSYGRPSLRGRTAFGGVVHWGEMWTPGANWATTLRVTKPVRLNDHPVRAGSYSLWIVPTPDQWTVYLHREPRLYHLQRPKPTDMLLALPVTPSAAPSSEHLTFSFPEVRRDGTTLQFQWGPTALSLRIDVSPSTASRPKLTAPDVAPYVGEYTAWIFAENGDSSEMRQRLFYESGRLKGVIDDGARRFELFPTGVRHQFWFESHDESGPRDVEEDSPVVFAIDRSGRATGFSMKGIEQRFWMRGVRVKD